MQTKIINCKMKEIYFTPVEMKEEPEIIESRCEFWNSMNMYALQNMSIVQMKRA